MGSDPQLLTVSDDGSTLWVTLPGALAIRRVALPELTPGIQFTVRSEFGSPLLVEDIEVQPGNADVIAISRFYQEGISPRHAGVAVYDDGVLRPLATASHLGANRIEFTDDPGLLVGIDTEGIPAAFYRIRVDGEGATQIDATADLAGGVEVELEFAGNRVYQTQGSVVDPSVPRRIGDFQNLPYFLALLAEAYGREGRLDVALNVLTEALTVLQTGDRQYEAELYRLKGTLAVRARGQAQDPGIDEEAQKCFCKAAEIARRQSAKSLELRAVVSLSRLWQQQGKREEARRILAGTYNWFTEGFDTADLKEARALLDELS